MKIAELEAIPLKIPFSIGPVQPKSGGQPWTAQEIVLVRVETEDGLVGWGEAFSYSCQRPVVAAIEDMIAPLAVGRLRRYHDRGRAGHDGGALSAPGRGQEGG